MLVTGLQKFQLVVLHWLQVQLLLHHLLQYQLRTGPCQRQEIGLLNPQLLPVEWLLLALVGIPVGEDLSTVLGKKVVYRPQTLESFEADFGPTRAAFFEYLANGFYTRCSPDFYNLTGRKPTAYLDYLRSKGAAGETGLEELYQGNMWKKGEDAMKEAASKLSKQ